MDDQLTILVAQRRGTNVGWTYEDFYGPFSSKEERAQWQADPINALPKNWRYVVFALAK